MELKLIKEEIADLEKSRAVGTLTPYGCRYLKELTYVVEQLSVHLVSERYILVEWLNGKPIIDGSTCFDTKEECLEYYNELPKLAGYDTEYTICTIRNAR